MACLWRFFIENGFDMSYCKKNISSSLNFTELNLHVYVLSHTKVIVLKNKNFLKTVPKKIRYLQYQIQNAVILWFLKSYMDQKRKILSPVKPSSFVAFS